ncbi:MAG: phospholipase D family protein [Deltaproteobacteria bacterium]|jgi:hypothetical protein|nr:phospholipase D family protein [Deltaproteobacteria bacterium]
MLNPQSDRDFYSSALRPPSDDMVFDEAIATTYSVNLEFLLDVSAQLGLSGPSGWAFEDETGALEALGRVSEKLTVYAQKTQIQAPSSMRVTRLVPLLEGMILQVVSPGHGVFHPKVWAIRYVNPNSENLAYRLLVLTRNMTFDRSWDIILNLDGVVQGRYYNVNRPLVQFFETLPLLARSASEKVDIGRERQAQRFAEELHYVRWNVPEGYDDLAFYLPGIEGFDWEPKESKRLTVITPFCSDQALKDLTGYSENSVALISRPETLTTLNEETLGLFKESFYLDENAERENGEELEFAIGLHSKVYLSEFGPRASQVSLVIGSANATNAALIAKRNIEFLVELTGKKKNVGGIDDLLSQDSLGGFLINFNPEEVQEIDNSRKEAEKNAESARSAFIEAILSVECEPTAREDHFKMSLKGKIPLLEGIVEALAWPVTVSRQFATNILHVSTEEIILGEFQLASLTNFIVFELKTEHPEVSVRFVMKLQAKGFPEERHDAIIRTVIRSHDDFTRYLLFRLRDENQIGHSTFTRKIAGRPTTQRSAGDYSGLLEELIRAFCKNPDSLKELSKTIEVLSHGGENEVVTGEFMQFWEVFKSALEVFNV